MLNLISVIVPVYNVENYLKNCVESILRQTYANFELILVNDGSTDSSLELCKEFENKDDRISVIDKVNGGLSSARNSGLDVAKGKYITFIDSDDIVHDKYLEILLNTIEKNKCDLVYSPFLKFTKVNEICLQGTGSEILYNGVECFEQLFSQCPEYLITSTGKLFKYELFTNLRFAEGKIHEDEFIIHHILNKCNSICFIDYSLYFYFIREGSIMNSKFNKKRLVRLEALIDRYEILKDTKYCDNQVERILEDCLYFYKQIEKTDLNSRKYLFNIFKYYFKLLPLKFNKKYFIYLLFRICPVFYVKLSR